MVIRQVSASCIGTETFSNSSDNNVYFLNQNQWIQLHMQAPDQKGVFHVISKAKKFKLDILNSLKMLFVHAMI